MALWQYSLIVIPHSSDVERLELDEDGYFDDEYHWLRSSITKDVFNPMEEILPLGKSWDEELLLYGEENSHRFTVYFEEGDKVVCVTFRIDFTQEYEDILRLIIEFLVANNLAIVDTTQLQILSPNYETIKHTIESSPQVTRYRELCSK